MHKHTVGMGYIVYLLIPWHLPLSGRNGFNFFKAANFSSLKSCLCPGRPRIAVDIVGCILVGYLSLSGVPPLDLSESAVRDYCLKNNENQVSPSRSSTP